MSYGKKSRGIEYARDLQSYLSDIDEFDLALSSEGFDLLRESGSRKKPKTKVVSWPFQRNERCLSAKLLQDVNSDRLLTICTPPQKQVHPLPLRLSRFLHFRSTTGQPGHSPV
jgi:hypothetical protein